MFPRKKRQIRFTLLMDKTERKIIHALAERLGRSQGDAIRYLLKKAEHEFRLSQEKSNNEINLDVEFIGEITNGHIIEG
ncbi:MAG: hypothetical protein AAGU75_22865 [Bacillota bacterium]